MSVGLYLHRLRDKNLHVRHIVQIFLRKNSIKAGEFIHAGGIWAIVFCSFDYPSGEIPGFGS